MSKSYEWNRGLYDIHYNVKIILIFNIWKMTGITNNLN